MIEYIRMAFCGGNLIKAAAAHWFWDISRRAPGKFGVAVGRKALQVICQYTYSIFML